MKMLSQGVRCVCAAAAVFALVALAPTMSAADENIGINVATLSVSSKLGEADVESAITQALVARKWIVRDKKSGEIVAHYERGPNVCTLTIRYDDEAIDIFAVGDSRGGGLPMRWIENLKKDIDVYLGRVLLTK